LSKKRAKTAFFRREKGSNKEDEPPLDGKAIKKYRESVVLGIR